ncbi:MAG: DUF362 domain-containing protein [bacterium]
MFLIRFAFIFSLTACALFLSDGYAVEPEKKKSRVVILEDPSLVSRFSIDSVRAAQAFNRAFLAFTKSSTVEAGWRTLVQPQDIIGIKIVAPGNPIMASNRAVLEAVVDGLKKAGVKPSNIIIWDKFADQMMASGYIPTESAEDWQLRAVLPDSGFDGKKFYFNEVAGKLIWGDYEFVGVTQIANLAASAVEKEKTESGDLPVPDQISNRSFFAKIVTQQVTKIINLAVMTDHHDLGIYGASASLAMSSVDNTRRFLMPQVRGDPAVGEILNHEALKDKVVLHVMTGLIAQFAGGPAFHPHYAQSPGLLLISRDPVALDTLALERLEEWRKEKVVPPIGEDAKHLKAAASLGAGTNDKKQMEIVKLPVAP